MEWRTLWCPLLCYSWQLTHSKGNRIKFAYAMLASSQLPESLWHDSWRARRVTHRQNSNLRGSRFPTLLPPVWDRREDVPSQSGKERVEITHRWSVSSGEDDCRNPTNGELSGKLYLEKQSRLDLPLAPSDCTNSVPSLQYQPGPLKSHELGCLV